MVAVRPFFLPVVLACDIYGYLDGIVRFPSIPKLESFFCLKLFSSVIVKTVAYSIGFVNIHNWALIFLSALVLNVWLLPVLYVLAVPYGDGSPFRKDRDMLLQLCVYLIDAKEREDAKHRFSASLEWLSTALSSKNGQQPKGMSHFILDEKAFI